MSEQASAHGPRVVVGVDGEAPSRLALEWAAHEASLRGARLEVVYAMYFRRELLDVFDDASTHEQAVLDAEVARARSLEPSLAVVGSPPTLRPPGHSLTPVRAPTCSSSAHVASAASKSSPSARSATSAHTARPALSSSCGPRARSRSAIPAARTPRSAPFRSRPGPKGSGQLERVPIRRPTAYVTDAATAAAASCRNAVRQTP